MSIPADLSDEAWQLAVLTLVLGLHPEHLSTEELEREMLADRHGFTETDAHYRAVRDLIASGLLRRDGDTIIPTRAAMRFHQLHA